MDERFPVQIFIDGQDRTGKTSLISPLAKAIEFSSIISDRGPLGFVTYDYHIRGENTTSRYYKRKLLHNTATILLAPPISFIKERTERSGEVFDLELAERQAAWFSCEANRLRAIASSKSYNHNLIVLENTYGVSDTVTFIVEELLS